MSGDGAEVAVSEPIRLSNRQLIGPGCVRSLGTDVSPNQSRGVRVSASLASDHLTASCPASFRVGMKKPRTVTGLKITSSGLIDIAPSN